MRAFSISTMLMLCLCCGSSFAQTAFRSGEILTEWIVLGPLPNPVIPPGDRTGPVDGAGFDLDYFSVLGGEAQAVLEAGATIAFEDAGRTETAEAVAVAGDPAEGVNFMPLFERTDRKVSYAYCEVESDEDQRVHGLFGSDDRAMVWVNGTRVHRFDAAGRALTVDEDHFSFDLKKGRNRILVKVENGVGEWSFSLRLRDEDTQRREEEKRRHVQYIRDVQAVELRTDPPDRFTFPPGPFPEIVWAQPQLIESAFGEMPLRIRWFDADLNEVERADQPGRYAAYVEGTAKDGSVVRRALTLFCAPADFEPWRYPLGVSVPRIDQSGIGAAAWSDQAKMISLAGDEAWIRFLFEDQGGAIAMAGLHDRHREIEAGDTLPRPAWYSPSMRHQVFHLKLKHKILGSSNTVRPLAPPRTKEGEAAPVLRSGSEKDAGFTRGIGEEMDALCRQWAETSGIPFTFLVARNGVIAHEGAYGSTMQGPATTDSAFDIASISKLLTVALVLQFVDQGLIDLDDPIGKYLPDLPAEGEKAMTIRQCLTHTAGTDGHGNWGGFDNPWFENIAANGIDTYEPGRRYLYNGLSLNLVGRVLEAVSGTPYPVLMQKNLYVPLGNKNTRVFDTSFGTRTTALEIGRVGQLLLNRGSYGALTFFSPETQAKMYPAALNETFPGLQSSQVYGLGSAWATPMPGANASSAGRRYLTHGSATQSVLIVGLDDGLVISMTRPTVGPEYAQYYNPILETIMNHMVD